MCLVPHSNIYSSRMFIHVKEEVVYLNSAFKISKWALSDGLSRIDIDEETNMVISL